MAKTGIQRKSKKQQSQDAQLESIIDEMGRAMRDANPAYISGLDYSVQPLTLKMSMILDLFREYCKECHGKKA